ncbi:hypothetical protein [Brevundimonas sp. GCM10030266]|uniref:hypothetical protein n=1 Tax=Brevundimonas sp. GCM10030266 TaxID=3273386 RepID=UPI003614963E
MIKALSLAAALTVLPITAAVAADPQTTASDASSDAAEAAIEAAAERLETRMEAFGERADAISDDDALSETEKKTRIAALWAEYEPDVTAFTAIVTEHAGAIAGAALADVDIGGIIEEAMAGVNESGVLHAATGVAANGAWASNDPEHMATYGLVAEYALGEALDSIDEVTGGEIDVSLEDAEAGTVAVAVATPAPTPSPARAD